MLNTFFQRVAGQVPQPATINKCLKSHGIHHVSFHRLLDASLLLTSQPSQDWASALGKVLTWRHWWANSDENTDDFVNLAIRQGLNCPCHLVQVRCSRVNAKRHILIWADIKELGAHKYRRITDTCVLKAEKRFGSLQVGMVAETQLCSCLVRHSQ